jgi:hypothetical protein
MANEDYIDTVVLAEKPQLADPEPDTPARTNDRIDVLGDVRLSRVGGIEVNTLTIDEDPDFGGDPYNSTGKHCVLKRIKE